MSKRLIVFIVLNMLAILASIGFGVYAYVMAGRYFARDIVYIAPKLNMSHLHFTPAEIDRLSREHPGINFSTESRGSIRVETHAQAATTPVIFTDTYYFSIHTIDFIQGSHWQSRLNVNSIVINQALAWRLFGAAQDIVGLNVWISERPFTIVGVVYQRHSNEYLAWMPNDDSLPISTIYAQLDSPSLLAVSMMHEMMELGLRRQTDAYAIVCINRYVESIGLRYQLLLGIVWMFVLVLLLKLTWRNLLYVPTAVKRGRTMAVIKGIVLPVLWVGVCVFLILGINDILYWIPNLSDPTISAFESISTIGLLPPEGYLPYGLLRLSRLSRYVNLAFIVGIAGLVNLLFCLKLPVVASVEYEEEELA